MNSKFLALTLLLLVLGCDAQGVPQEDEATGSTIFSQVNDSLESLLGYWDIAKTAAQDLYGRVAPTSVEKQIRDMYAQSTAAVTTYAGIFTDQLFFLIRGDQ